jgi:uncharacterized protein YbgA (DUF1722 family)
MKMRQIITNIYAKKNRQTFMTNIQKHVNGFFISYIIEEAQAQEIVDMVAN